MDNKGQMNVGLIGGLGVAGVLVVIMVLIYSEVYAGINKQNVPTSAQNLLTLVPLLLAALGVVAIAVAMILIAR